MATSVDEQKINYPIPVYYYEVTIDGIDSIAFSEVSGLTIEYETITYKDGLSYKHGAIHMPGMGTPVNLTLKKGVFSGDSKLYDWLSTIKLNKVTKKDVTVTLKDENDEPVATWTVKNAFPKKMDAPSFNATSNEVAIESLDLMADDLTVVNE